MFVSPLRLFVAARLLVCCRPFIAALRGTCDGLLWPVRVFPGHFGRGGFFSVGAGRFHSFDLTHPALAGPDGLGCSGRWPFLDGFLLLLLLLLLLLRKHYLGVFLRRGAVWQQCTGLFLDSGPEVGLLAL